MLQRRKGDQDHQQAGSVGPQHAEISQSERKRGSNAVDDERDRSGPALLETPVQCGHGGGTEHIPCQATQREEGDLIVCQVPEKCRPIQPQTATHAGHQRQEKEADEQYDIVAVGQRAANVAHPFDQAKTRLVRFGLSDIGDAPAGDHAGDEQASDNQAGKSCRKDRPALWVQGAVGKAWASSEKPGKAQNPPQRVTNPEEKGVVAHDTRAFQVIVRHLSAECQVRRMKHRHTLEQRDVHRRQPDELG